MKKDTEADPSPPSFKTITEGSTSMTYPADQELSVFYNPVQVQNRDLSILMIALYAERRAKRKAIVQKKKEIRKQLLQEHVDKGMDNPRHNMTKQQRKELEDEIQKRMKEYEDSLDGSQLIASQEQHLQQNESSGDERNDTDGLTILDALAASGLRSIRYWKEIPGVKHVMINDLELAAVERAFDNIRHNNLEDALIMEEEDNEKLNATGQKISCGSGSDFSQRRYGICIQQGDATHEMYVSRRPQQLLTSKIAATTNGSDGKHDEGKKFRPKLQQPLKPMWDVIDLDPYGSAAPFLDSAIQGVENGGLLCVTCTDMAALGGSHPETAYGRYGALPIQSAPYLQELALRILLQSMATIAARYGRAIRPVLSVGMAFYVRVFVEIVNDKQAVTNLSLRIGHVYQSTRCPSFLILPNGMMGGKKKNVYQSVRLPQPAVCPDTGAPFKVGGPLWLGPLHDLEVVQEALDRLLNKGSNQVDENVAKKLDINQLATKDRLIGLLSSVREELGEEAPLYYTLSGLCSTLHISSPPLKSVMAALHNAGYRVSGYHKDPHAIKTTAPSTVVWDVLRAWCKQHPPKTPPAADSTAHHILSVHPHIDVDFTIPKGNTWLRPSTGNLAGVARFPQNPTKYWGPKPKATNKTSSSTSAGKRKHYDTGNEEKGDHSAADDDGPLPKKAATNSNTGN